MLNTTWQMMLVAIAGWVNEQQLAVIEYLKEENPYGARTGPSRKSCVSKGERCVD